MQLFSKDGKGHGADVTFSLPPVPKYAKDGQPIQYDVYLDRLYGYNQSVANGSLFDTANSLYLISLSWYSRNLICTSHNIYYVCPLPTNAGFTGASAPVRISGDAISSLLNIKVYDYLWNPLTSLGDTLGYAMTLVLKPVLD